MSFANLSAAGWILFGITVTMILGFLKMPLRDGWRGAFDLGWFGLLITLTCYLMSGV